MAKVTLTDVTNGSNAVAAINANSAAIEAASDTWLSRDGTSPNQMEAHLDMNSYRIINLAAPVNANDAVRLADLAGEGVSVSIPDDDYGDIVVTSSGQTMSIAPAVATAAGRAVMGAADASAQRTALGLGTAATSNAGDFSAAGVVPAHVALGYEGAHPGIEAFVNTAATLLANTAVAGHEAAPDPHPGYTTAADVSASITAHEGLPDPHPAYQLESGMGAYQATSAKGTAGGYASLDGSTHVPVAQLGGGTPDNTKFLRGDGTWEVTGGGGAGAVNDLTDATIAAATAGQVFVYNGSQWVNGKVDLTDADAANFDGTGTAFYETGTFSISGTGAGWAVPPTTTLRYTRVGRVVTLAYESGDVNGTLSSATAYRAVFGVGLPASIRPSVDRKVTAVAVVGFLGVAIYGPIDLDVRATGALTINGVLSDYATSSLVCPVELGPQAFAGAAVGFGANFCATYSM